ncbi:MAG: hypothetical protein JXB26_08565 [Candidatus Aminicenantes bacterium]|nr:hypothetical protein [Candidatus Aminicenantes bacterium]
MKKTVVVLFVFVLSLFIVSILLAAPSQEEIVPAKTQWAIHIDIEKMISTRLGQTLKKEESHRWIWKRKHINRKLKFDPVKDLKSVTVFWGEGMGPEPAAFVKGKFDRNFLLGLLEEEESHRETSYGETTIHHWNDDDYGAFYGEDMIVFSESEKSLKVALDVLTGKSKGIPISKFVDPKIMSKDVFLTAFASDISSLKKYDRSFILEKMDSMNLTASERGDKLDIRLNLMTVAAKDAENMKHVIRGLMAMADLKLEKIESKTKITDVVQISADGKELHLQLVYPVEELLDILLGKKDLDLFHLARHLESYH